MTNCIVMVDGRPIEEPYLDSETVSPGNCGGDFTSIVVPRGEVFILGDNRSGSMDSRVLGSISLDDLVGTVVAVRQPGDVWKPVTG